MRAVRATAARYMLALAAASVRADGLSQPLYLALGNGKRAFYTAGRRLGCHLFGQFNLIEA